MGDLINGNGYSGTSCPKGSYWNGIECVSSGPGHNPMDTEPPLRRPVRGETVGLLRGGGRVKPVRRNMANGGVAKAKPTSRPVKRNMANGGVAKAKPTSRPGCCRGNGGRATPRPNSRPNSRPTSLRGGSRGGIIR